MKKTIAVILLILFLGGVLWKVFFDNSNSNTNKGTQVRLKKETKLLSPSYNKLIKLKDSVIFVVSNQKDAEKQFDSVQIWDGPKIIASTTNRSSLVLPTKNLGEFNYKVKAFWSGKQEEHFAKFTVLASKEPKVYSFSLLNTYPHNNDHYTQGYEFYNDNLYEGTGRKGNSIIAITNPKSGSVNVSNKLDDKYFGEGITILNGKIYQLTWQARKGFVYDVMSLEPQGEFSYESEGWGLTNNGTSLIMSDGSNKLRFFNPETMQTSKELYVYNNSGKVSDLNELEFVDQSIWANRYTYNEIVHIDSQTGEVIGVLDLSVLLGKLGNNHVDYLNGIAFNPKTETYWVTGKLWPKAFEIKIDLNQSL